MSITALRPGGNITPAVLHELADNPELEGFLIVCNWKQDNLTTVGWSNMKMSDLTYLVTHAQIDVNDAIRERS